MSLLKIILLVNLALITNLSNALVMPATGSSLVIDQNETLYVDDGDVFNLSSFDLKPGSILDIYSNTPNATFSIIASNAITLSGLLNVYLSNLSFVSESFYLSATLSVKGNSISVDAPYISITGTIDLTGSGGTDAPIDTYGGSSGVVLTQSGFPVVPRLPTAGIIIGNNTNMPVTQPWISATNVPEPQGYTMLLAGLGLMGVVASRRQL